MLVKKVGLAVQYVELQGQKELCNANLTRELAGRGKYPIDPW